MSISLLRQVSRNVSLWNDDIQHSPDPISCHENALGENDVNFSDELSLSEMAFWMEIENLPCLNEDSTKNLCTL